MNSQSSERLVAPAHDSGTSPPQHSVLFSLVVGGLVSGLAVWLILRSVNLNQTRDALFGSNLLWFALAFFVQLLASFLVLRRWQILLAPYTTRFNSLTQIYFSAHLLNTLLPVKLGTVARVLLAAESENLNVGFVLGSVAIEKVLDTCVMLVLLLALMPFVPLPEWLRDSLLAGVLLFLLTISVLATVRRLREPLLNALARLETRLFGRASVSLVTFVRGVLESLMNLTQRREAASVVFWTVLVWLAGGVVNQLLFLALNIPVPWSAAWLVLVALQLGTRIPALPANLGVFHYVAILALGLYGVNESDALAYAILLHLIVFVLPAFVGAVCALPLSARLWTLVSNGLRRSPKQTV